MTKSVVKTLASGLVLSLGMATAVAAQEVKWDLPVQWPEGNFMTQVVHDYAAEVSKRSDGEIELTVHSGGALGVKGADMIGAMRDGVFNIGEYSLAQAVGEEPLFGLERLPGLFESYEAFAVFSAVARPAYQAKLDDHNQIMLFNVPWPQSHIHVRNDVTSLDELAGLKIRTYDPFGTQFYQNLGANPIQMPWAEVIPALASGVLDGVHTSASSAVDGKFWEFLGSTRLLFAQTSTSGLFVNADAFDSLSDEHQDILVDVASEMEVSYWLKSKADEASRISVLEENGMTVSLAADDIREAAFGSAQKIASDYAAEVPAAKAVLDQYYTLRSK